MENDDPDISTAEQPVSPAAPANPIPRDVIVGLVFIGIFVGLCGVVRMIALAVQNKWDDAFNHESLLWFVLAGVLIVLPWVSKFKLGKDGSLEVELAVQRKEVAKVKRELVETKQTAQEGTALAEKAIKTANVLKSVSGIVMQEERKAPVLGETHRVSTFAATGLEDAVEIANDPQKGRWGGQSEVNGWKLVCGRVRAVNGTEDFFRVVLKLKSVDHKEYEGRVKFHLHPSFRPDVYEEDIEKGRATLELLSYGAFTVGAEIDDGTKLELDLAGKEVEAPERFKES
jgi:hypothetical protein